MNIAMKLSRISFAVTFIYFLTGCAASIQDYRNESPKLAMEDYFNGPLEAWGMVQDFSGKVTKRFYVKMTGTWEGDEGTLDEHFVYADGKKQRRIWNLKKIGHNEYTGTADDVIGTASGIAEGNALRWHYTLELPVDDQIYHIGFDDWMFRINDEIVINRSVMKKFGVTVGEVTLVFQRGSANLTQKERTLSQYVNGQIRLD